MADDAAQDSVEEELRAGWSKPTARIVLLVAVVLLAALALVFLARGGHPRSPTGRSTTAAPVGTGPSSFGLSASDALRPGSSNRKRG
jgi:hypothetical protein